ncbi:hypothetical protein [Streptomyces sp. NPDC002573]|uniref:hypothetical protein n=1 Tax=Streptomyces sp. NPDC002573 TaxID=3364651 RepID=UPI0036AE071B
MGGRLVSVENGEHLGARLYRVRIEREGQDFALKPGGEVTLGFDPDTWTPTPEQIDDYAVSVEQGYGYGPDLLGYLTQVLNPRRHVRLAASNAQDLWISPGRDA